MRKIVVTGANGVGKSHFAALLASARPEIPVVSFDALKLKTDWEQRSRPEIDAALTRALETEAWILEGGPSLLPRAIAKADALVWLDPPEPIRAWRLAKRPWTHIGKTRPELPPGNVDWPWQQTRFAFRSLKNRSRTRALISGAFAECEGLQKWRCRDERDRIAVVGHWATSVN